MRSFVGTFYFSFEGSSVMIYREDLEKCTCDAILGAENHFMVIRTKKVTDNKKCGVS